MARKPKQDRQPAKVARDRALVARLYLAGRYQADIAAELGVSQSTVSRHLRDLQALWLKESVAAIDKKKALELAKLDVLELEFWDAWRRSQTKSEKSTVVRRGAGVGQAETAPVDELRIVTERQVGDARFLAGVLDCIERRCSILGIDAPKKIEATGDGLLVPASVNVYLPDNHRAS